MTISYPTEVWDGDSENRDSDLSPQKAPDWRDWSRLVAEVAATQTRVDANDGGRSSDAFHTVGAVATKTGLSIVEHGDGAMHKTVITLDEVEVVTTDGSDSPNDAAWGTQTLYTFPVGRLAIMGAHAQFPVAGLEAVTGGGGGLSDTADFGIGVGTVAIAQAVGFGLAGTEEDVCAEMDADLTSKTSDAIETNAQITAAIHNGTSSAIDIHLNIGTLDDSDHGASADVLKVSGVITILWTMLGDD